MGDDVVRLRRVGLVAVLEMHRPERHNAMDASMVAALLDHLAGLASDPSAGAVVLTGAGGSFCSGADLAGEGDPTRAGIRMEDFAHLYETVTAFPKPSVAAIAGACIGAGAEVAACCDLRAGAPSASIRFPGARFGVPVGAARLPALIGVSHAKDLLMTSRTIGADEAWRIGFLNRLTTQESLEDEAVALAALMAALPGATTQKRLVDETCGLTAGARSESRALGRWKPS